MKDKLYNFIDKYHTALGVCALASLFGMILVGDSKQLVAVILLLLYFPIVCALMFHMVEATVRSHEKARQEYAAWHRLYLDKLNSGSPHWDGQVRSSLDIEPRLKLLRARMEKDREEINYLLNKSKKVNK
jgi:hypothetical protein